MEKFWFKQWHEEGETKCSEIKSLEGEPASEGVGMWNGPYESEDQAEYWKSKEMTGEFDLSVIDKKGKTPIQYQGMEMVPVRVVRNPGGGRYPDLDFVSHEKATYYVPYGVRTSYLWREDRTTAHIIPAEKVWETLDETTE